MRQGAKPTIIVRQRGVRPAAILPPPPPVALLPPRPFKLRPYYLSSTRNAALLCFLLGAPALVGALAWSIPALLHGGVAAALVVLALVGGFGAVAIAAGVRRLRLRDVARRCAERGEERHYELDSVAVDNRRLPSGYEYHLHIPLDGGGVRNLVIELPLGHGPLIAGGERQMVVALVDKDAPHAPVLVRADGWPFDIPELAAKS